MSWEKAKTRARPPTLYLALFIFREPNILNYSLLFLKIGSGISYFSLDWIVTELLIERPKKNIQQCRTLLLQEAL